MFTEESYRNSCVKNGKKREREQEREVQTPDSFSPTQKLGRGVWKSDHRCRKSSRNGRMQTAVIQRRKDVCGAGFPKAIQHSDKHFWRQLKVVCIVSFQGCGVYCSQESVAAWSTVGQRLARENRTTPNKLELSPHFLLCSTGVW